MEVRIDQSSVRRYRRRTALFLLAVALAFAGGLVGPVASALFGRGVGDRLPHAMILVGFLVALSSPLWGSLDRVYYRCPRCRRKLPRVSPEGVAEANYHYACVHCEVTWDLGWAWRSGGRGRRVSITARCNLGHRGDLDERNFSESMQGIPPNKEAFVDDSRFTS